MRKRRTRQHIIADLSFNHLEWYVLKCGFTIDPTKHDYGIDANIYTYNDNGEIQDGFIHVQLKASDNFKYLKREPFVSFSIEKAHLDNWLSEPIPVILVLYDPKKHRAYWSYLQRHLKHIEGFSLDKVKNRYSIRVPTKQVINKEAIRKFAEFKNRILNQLNGVIDHG